MKTLFTILALVATIVVKAGNFSMVEVNPLHGYECTDFTDSNKLVYGAGELSGFVELNGKLYFSARDSYDNDELWSTDGTQDGLHLVKEINPDGGARIGNLVKAGNRILFMAADNNNYDFDLWSTDGTAAGTIKVADLNQDWNSSLDQGNMAVRGSQVIFCTHTALMVSDGTVAGTDSLTAIETYSQGFGYCELNNKVYFIIPGNSWGESSTIWNTDGTVAGTHQVLDLGDSSIMLTSVTQMQSFNGKIFLNASVSGQGNDLYIYDGNVNGQINKVNLVPTGNAYPSPMTLYNGALYFTAYINSSYNIYRIMPGGNTPQPLIQNSSVFYLNQVTFANNSVYYISENQQFVHRIDLTTLAHTLTDLHQYAMPSYTSLTGGLTSFLVGQNGKVYFAVYDTATQNQVFVSADENLTNIKTIMPSNANIKHPFNRILSCGFIDEFDFKFWGDKILVPANFDDAGRELWIFDTNDQASGINETSDASGFTVFPNPTFGTLTAKANVGNGYCDQQVKITAVDGSVMMQNKLSSGNATLDMGKLASGNYFVTLLENGKAVSSKKVILVK